MNLSDWAKNEVEIMKRTNTDAYGTAILNSALKALLTLSEDGHSGMSIGMTQQILNRLIDYKPLTPLTGDDSEWDNDIVDRDDSANYICYQNNRYSALFKYVYDNGDVRYSDVNRFVCEDINTGSRFHNGGVSRIVAELVEPITFPYSPSDKPIVIFVDDFLFDERNGDFDHRATLYAELPDGTTIDINRYQSEVNGEFVDITKEEYLKNKVKRIVHSEFKHSDESDAQKAVDKLEFKGNISDGSHTFTELYYHRMMLFSIICNSNQSVAWKSWKHDDGTMYEDYFIVGVSLPNGDFAYHYHKDHWNKFKVKTLRKAPKYDGHTPDDITRLEYLTKEV